MADLSLVEWAGKQTAWVQDSLRRISTTAGFMVSEEDRKAILDRIKYAADGIGDEPACDALTAEHLSQCSETGPRAVLASIGPLQNIDRLAKDQRLRFAPTGVTLIFWGERQREKWVCAHRETALPQPFNRRTEGRRLQDQTRRAASGESAFPDWRSPGHRTRLGSDNSAAACAEADLGIRQQERAVSMSISKIVLPTSPSRSPYWSIMGSYAAPSAQSFRRIKPPLRNA